MTGTGVGLCKNYGELFPCEECGRETERHSANQRYCPGCAYITRLRGARDSRTRDREQAKAAAAAIAIPKPAKPVERECDLNTLTLDGKRTSRIVAEARAFGMTYGTYTAIIREGSAERVLRARGFTDPEAVLRGLTIK